MIGLMFRDNKYRNAYCGELRSEHAGRDVVLSGWLHRKRDLGGILFVMPPQGRPES